MSQPLSTPTGSEGLLDMAGKSCEDTFWMTLKTCVQPLDDGTTYVVTGDIDAMWIRDSSAQLQPYVTVAEKQGPNSALWPVLEGAVRRQAQFMRTDPYANAFTKDWDSAADVRLSRGGFVFTGNYELDGGAHFFRFLTSIAAARPDAALLRESQVHKVVQLLITLYRQEQQHAFGQSEYTYPKAPPFELPGPNGEGLPVNYTGMVWGAFRPSDDPQDLNYHIPGNIFLAATLAPIVRLATDVWGDQNLAVQASDLRSSIIAGVRQFGTTQLPNGDKVYCYEVDGLGGCKTMDDANVPNLLSLPYLDPDFQTFDSEIYKSTRRFVLSSENPWYVQGHAGRGLGSPHTGKEFIWPLGLVMQLITATIPQEKQETLALLAKANQGKFGLTESFHKDTIGETTREWFGWPNSLFGEYLMAQGRCHPQVEDATIPSVRKAPRAGPLVSSSIDFYDADPSLLMRQGVTLPKASVSMYRDAALG